MLLVEVPQTLSTDLDTMFLLNQVNPLLQRKKSHLNQSLLITQVCCELRCELGPVLGFLVAIDELTVVSKPPLDHVVCSCLVNPGDA